MDTMYPGFTRHELDDRHFFYVGTLPALIKPDCETFATIWSMHPGEYHEIMMHGCLVKTPRWQQAFGSDYHYTGRVNAALAVPSVLQGLLRWGRTDIHPQLNGLLLNWYEGRLRHYIGPHHDSIKNMVHDAPIVTISLGEERVFRLTHPKTKMSRDFAAVDGTVFIMPFDTNRAWKHQVPRFARWQGRRISVTLRAFEQ